MVMVKEVGMADVNSNMNLPLSPLPTTTLAYPTSGGVGADDYLELWSEEEELGIPTCPMGCPSPALVSLPNCQVSAVPLPLPVQPPVDLAHTHTSMPTSTPRALAPLELEAAELSNIPRPPDFDAPALGTVHC